MNLPRTRQLALAAVAATAALASLTGCADKSKPTKVAETEGIYVEVGDLSYQVQISRQLNPRSVEDREYLAGVPAAEVTTTPQETLFAVFVRVKNEGDETAVPVSRFEIEDTLGNRFQPLTLGASNQWAYRAAPLAGKAVEPSTDSGSGQGPIQGSLILFKLPLESFQNRPLILHLTQAVPHDEAEIHLDV